MQIFNSFHDLPQVYSGCVIALGTFDGIHLGHVDVITTAKKQAMAKGNKCIVFSFSNHPLENIAPERAPTRLCSEDKKKELLSGLDVDVLFNMRFDNRFAALSSEEFILNLRRYFSPSCIVIGDNYSYGYLGAGNAQTLTEDGLKYGFSVIVEKLVMLEDVIINSSTIRKFIMDGDIPKANKLLGRQYSVRSEVIHGDKRGRTLGFPTANMKIGLHGETLPADGIYAAFVKLGGEIFRALASIGQNPTFGARPRRLEVYILDFERDIYGKQLEVAFIARLRREKKFSGADELSAQIKKDVRSADEYLSAADISF